MKLTRLERNTIYEAITQANLNATQFNLEIASNTAIISYDSGSSFAFEYTPRTADEPASYTVLAMVIDGSTQTFTCTAPISSLIPSIQRWAKEAKLVEETPDYWEEMQRSRELVLDIQQEGTDNSAFTQDEQKQIVAQFEEIKKHFREQFALTGAQFERIEERLDELVEATERMGRKDWFVYVLGTITALIITATVPGAVGDHIMTVILTALIHLFLGGSEPPQILS